MKLSKKGELRLIRQAKKNDGQAIVDLLFIIFKDMELPVLAKISETELKTYVLEAMEDDSYRYAYKNGLVYDDNGTVAGVVYGYLSKDEDFIDLPLDKIFAEKNYANEQLFSQKEGFPDEWYLDSIVTRKDYRGRGIGAALLAELNSFAEKAGADLIGLNVDKKNPRAKQLYEREGFSVVGETMISNHEYEHMQRKIKN